VSAVGRELFFRLSTFNFRPDGRAGVLSSPGLQPERLLAPSKHLSFFCPWGFAALLAGPPPRAPLVGAFASDRAGLDGVRTLTVPLRGPRLHPPPRPLGTRTLRRTVGCTPGADRLPSSVPLPRPPTLPHRGDSTARPRECSWSGGGREGDAREGGRSALGPSGSWVRRPRAPGVRDARGCRGRGERCEPRTPRGPRVDRTAGSRPRTVASSSRGRARRDQCREAPRARKEKPAPQEQNGAQAAGPGRAADSRQLTGSRTRPHSEPARPPG
jgi:hypothetical protein